MKRLTDENSALAAAEAEWMMKEKSRDEHIRDLDRQLDQLNTLVRLLAAVTLLQLNY